MVKISAPSGLCVFALIWFGVVCKQRSVPASGPDTMPQKLETSLTGTGRGVKLWVNQTDADSGSPWTARRKTTKFL